MFSRVRQFSTCCLLALFVPFAAPRTARAQGSFDLGNIGVSKGQAVGIIVGAVAIVGAVGVGVYFVSRAHRVTGCLASRNGGFDLQGSSPDQSFRLGGQIGGLAVGQRVKVLGKKGKESSGERTFVVKSLRKNYGPCVPPARTASVSPSGGGGQALRRGSDMAAREAEASPASVAPGVASVAGVRSFGPLP